MRNEEQAAWIQTDIIARFQKRGDKLRELLQFLRSEASDYDRIESSDVGDHYKRIADRLEAVLNDKTPA